MQLFHNTFIAATALTLGVQTAAAQHVVTGQVVDADTREPLVGATVALPHAKQGVTTDLDGRFTIKVGELPAALRVDYIGYRLSSIDVYDDEEPIIIELSESRNRLNEVVVVGYGTQKRQNLTASVSTVRSESIKDLPVSSFEQVLQGRSSGVQITTPSGNLGTAPVVRVRGVASITSGNAPLYVVDGVPIQSGSLAYSANATSDVNILSSISPDDIASINVLKDASAAALYGSRAANGVILITTKQGQKGQARVSYNGWVGITSAVKKYDVLNANEYVDFKNQAVRNRWGTDNYNIARNTVTTDGTKAYALGYDANGNVIDTDWSKYVFRTGLQHSHAVSIDGGNDRVQYHLSTNYLNQEGMIKSEELSRLGASFNVSVQANKWLKLGTSHTISRTKTQSGDRSRGGRINAYAGLSRLAWCDAPNLPVYNADGTYNQSNGHLGYGTNTVFFQLDNPANVIASKSYLNGESLHWIGTFSAEVSPVKGLTLRTQYGRDYVNTEDSQFDSPYIVDGASQNGVATRVAGRHVQSTWSNTATYEFTLADSHNFNLLAGQEISKGRNNYWGARRTGLVDASQTRFEAAYNTTTSVAPALSENALVSLFGRINYDYRSRYILSLNYRRDGFSALSENHRWGNFGGASAAWRISEENWFRPYRATVTDLKVKTSWGLVGNTNIDDYAAKSFYSNVYYGSDGAFSLGQTGDSENLKWESSQKFDIGFEATLWDRLTIEFDFYRNSSTDLIFDVPVAPSKGIPNNSITTNAASMRNTGIELTLSADVVRKKGWVWNSSFNISTNHNKVTKLANGVESFLTGNNITQVGHSLSELYLYPTRGIDKETGRRIFVGADGEDVLVYYEKSGIFFTRDGEAYAQSKLKRQRAGGVLPTFYGGWTNSLNYKQWDATLFFQYSGGNWIYNNMKATLSRQSSFNCSKDYYENYWREDRTNAKYAYPVYGDEYSNGSSMPMTDLAERGDYIRLKNLVVGYTVKPQTSWLRNSGISSLRLYLQAQNLFTITGYDGLDPEVLSQTNNTTLRAGFDSNTAPQARTFTFGVQLGF